MGRTFLACAALAAVMFSMSACKCAAVGGSGSPGSTVCLPVPCTHSQDCSACYRGEADRNMGRLKDCLPPDGCCDCEQSTRTCAERFPGYGRDVCGR